jgi:PAS domain S-box-containing protein
MARQAVLVCTGSPRMSANPALDFISPTSAPLPELTKVAAQGHSVHFYEDDSVLLQHLSRTMGAALRAGDAAVIIATNAHRIALTKLLEQRGIDTGSASRQGRYVLLDAGETLSHFMVGGAPDAERFRAVIGKVITDVAKAAAVVKDETPRVAAFGEMVALLWAEGKQEAALQLELLWNELAQTHSFHLHCAYPLNEFFSKEHSATFEKICAAHSHVIPAESYTSLSEADERLRAITFLQQRALAVEAEMRERVSAQRELQKREDELRDFLENAVIGMHWVAADGTVLWANKAEMDLLGYAPQEYIGHHMSEFHVDAAVVEDMLQRLGRNEQLRGYEARLRCKDGSLRDVRIHSNALIDDGKFKHTRCFTVDITEEKKAQEAAYRLAAIVASSDDGIVSKDLNGVVTSWNAGAERIFGYRPEEIVGRSITTIIPPELQDDEKMILAKIRRGERIEHFETVRLTKDGERLHVSLTISPVRDKNGKVIGAAKIMRNVTQRKKLEEALHTSERLASVGRLAATVAHEINNPLEAIVNNIYLARHDKSLPQKVSRYLEVADQELARVSSLAQQTLGFYRDNGGPNWVSVATVVSEVLSIYDRKLHYKAVQLENNIANDLQLYIQQGELRQVLSNVIANAIDASREGGRIRITSRVCSLTSRRMMRITVADNGIGMSDEVKRKLFTPFFTTKEQVGTGLGLWHTKSLLEKQGGQIRLRSRQGEKSGTVVSIFLPATTD